jgi:hypothetical protein
MIAARPLPNPQAARPDLLMPRSAARVALGCVLFLLGFAGAAGAADDPAGWALCRRAIAAAEPGSGLPPGLLGAIALVESGRRDPRTGRVEPWPWSYNAAGEGRAAPTREAAVAEVAALLARGVSSIDVGCMQVNLAHHPAAFAGLDHAFDPEANLRYAIGFLRALHARTGNWADAIAQYHSGEAVRGLAYHRRVSLARLGAAYASGGGAVPVPLPPGAAAGLCAPGRIPVLVMRVTAGRPQRTAARPRIRCEGRAAQQAGG